MNRESRLAAVLLAAGPSTRLGQPKQLVKIGGETLVRRVSRMLLDLDAASVTVVSGCESETIENEIRDLPVAVTYNRNWEQGMGGSITCGVRQLADDVDGILVMVCDQWRLEIDDLTHLIDSWKSDISAIFVANWHEGEAFVSGPPVIFPSTLIPELKFMTRSRGARQVVDRHMEIVEFVTMENAAYDLDRPADLELIPGYN